MRQVSIRISVILLVAVCASCGGAKDDPTPSVKSSEQPTNRIELPASVRQNLGITWSVAKRERMEKVYSVPGEIIAVPELNWDFHAPVSGTVLKVVDLWQPVSAGDVLIEIVSPRLAETQQALFGELAQVEEAKLEEQKLRTEAEPIRRMASTLRESAASAKAAVESAGRALVSARELAKAAEARLAEVIRLRETEAVSATALIEAQTAAATALRAATETDRALHETEIEAAKHALDSATAHAKAEGLDRRLAIVAMKLATAEAAFAQRLSALAALCGVAPETLAQKTDGTPQWARMRSLSLRAPSAGVVTRVATRVGTWVERDERLIDVLDSTRVRFRARLPEGDVARLPEDLVVRVESPATQEARGAESAALRPLADARARAVMLEATLQNADGKLRVGTSATAHVVIHRSKHREVLVPAECVVRDGLESVVFRRDAANPDQVIRTSVTVGQKAMGWVEIVAGVGEGEELVRDGVHQLVRTGTGKSSGGGHFHADGTYHEGNH